MQGAVKSGPDRWRHAATWLLLQLQALLLLLLPMLLRVQLL